MLTPSKQPYKSTLRKRHHCPSTLITGTHVSNVFQESDQFSVLWRLDSLPRCYRGETSLLFFLGEQTIVNESPILATLLSTEGKVATPL